MKGTGIKLLGSRGDAKIFNWAGVKELGTEKEVREAIVDQFNRHLTKLNKTRPGLLVNPVKEAGMKMSGVDSNLAGISPIVLVQSDTIKKPDRGYELLFAEKDMRQATSRSFEVLDVSGGVTFYQHDEGEEAKLSKIPTTAKTTVSLLRFTGGFPILDDWLRYNEYYKIDELSNDTISRWYNKRATLFYGLLVALAAGINQTFDTTDVQTINNACSKILEDLEAAGYAVDENEEFVITCNPTLRGRIMMALAASYLNPNTNNRKIEFNIAAVISTTKIASTSYYVSIPGGKNQRGEWEDLNARPPQRNELVLGADHIWTGAYNGVIAESKQHRRCSLS
jgi:hypothetical protein